MAKPLDLDALQKMLAAPAPTKRAGGTRKKKEDIRTHKFWFTYDTGLGFCSNESCTDVRETRTDMGNTYVTTVNGIVMCRRCFVAGYGRAQDGPSAEVSA